MINGTEILRLVRLEVNDFDETKFSDYQILNAVNYALKYITQSKLLESAEFMVDKKNFTTTTGDLPDDYLSLIEVLDNQEYTLKPVNITKTPSQYEYKVMGEKVYCGASSWVLFYKKLILPISSFSSNINLPKFCTSLIVKATAMVLSGNDASTIIKGVDEIIAGEIPLRKYNKKKTVVGGGE